MLKSLSQLSCLVIDAHPIAIKHAENILLDIGVKQITKASTWSEGVAHLAKLSPTQKPQVILLGLKGDDEPEAILTQPLSGQTMRVIFAAVASDEQVQQWQHFTFIHQVIRKPLDPLILEAMLRIHVNDAHPTPLSISSQKICS